MGGDGGIVGRGLEGRVGTGGDNDVWLDNTAGDCELDVFRTCIYGKG